LMSGRGKAERNVSLANRILISCQAGARCDIKERIFGHNGR
jgi:hypothetical protein